jgi:hypothetical protein
MSVSFLRGKSALTIPLVVQLSTENPIIPDGVIDPPFSKAKEIRDSGFAVE